MRTNPLCKLVFVLGDIHGDFGGLNSFINTHIRTSRAVRELAAQWQRRGAELEVILLQCGDFAFYWPGKNNSRAIRNQVPFIRNERVQIYWCAGNHENHDALDTLFPDPLDTRLKEVAPGVWFARFGASLHLTPDITVLFAGGAESFDRAWRAPGETWWPQEGVSEGDMARLDTITRADWVISHTAPADFDLTRWEHRLFTSEKLREPSRDKLEELRLRFRPARWFFGHFHQAMSGCRDGCRWTGLSNIGSHARWWTKICLTETLDRDSVPRRIR